MESSIWDEPDWVLKVFMTMLAIKDRDHVVRKTAYQLHVLSRKTETEVLDALKVLSSPDKRRMEKQEFQGRRIKAVEEGWLILNGEKYRDMVSIEMKRARNRKSQDNYRKRQKAKKDILDSGPPPGMGLADAMDADSRLADHVAQEIEEIRQGKRNQVPE